MAHDITTMTFARPDRNWQRSIADMAKGPVVDYRFLTVIGLYGCTVTPTMEMSLHELLVPRVVTSVLQSLWTQSVV